MEAVRLASTKRISIEEWKRERMKGIGGSDVAAVLGISRWKSAIRVYLEKIGEAPEEEVNEAMEIGKRIEDFIADLFKEKTGLHVVRCNAILQSSEYPWMIANVDREVYDPETDSWGILELKNVSQYMQKDWEGEEIPPEAYVQLQHYLIVTGRTWGYIAGLIGGKRFEYKRFELDEELAEEIIRREEKFWKENVLKGIPPSADATEDCTEVLKVLFPESMRKSIDLPPEDDLIVEELETLKAQKEELEKEITLRENKLKERLGEAEAGFTGRFWVFWKSYSSKRFAQSKFKEERPKDYEAYLEDTRSRKFRFKRAA